MRLILANYRYKRNKLELIDLPQREDNFIDKNSNNSNTNPASKINDPCERDCDCETGLICYNGKCADNW